MGKVIFGWTYVLNIINEQIIPLFIAALVAVILIGWLAWQMKKRNRQD